MITRSALIYGAVSAGCLVLHNAIMIGGDAIGWPYLASILLSFCVVAATGYVLHSLLTFREPIETRRFLRYAAAMSANIPLAFIALWIWHDFAGLAMIWASPIATLCMIAVNFVLSRWAILSRPTRMT